MFDFNEWLDLIYQIFDSAYDILNSFYIFQGDPVPAFWLLVGLFSGSIIMRWMPSGMQYSFGDTPAEENEDDERELDIFADDDDF